ncbi:MAG: hypothetical protein CVU99_04735 [Firmicutes bacterium HGW-Firmicutes-4]|jgi:predicted transcriptional regulator YdeE|nr:MAG: hypothetical protein CVU99_04735 [Firmicutes bacterium HGW-Firmicutes-4]
MDIEIVQREKLCFLGYKVSIKKGLLSIPKLWHRLTLSSMVKEQIKKAEAALRYGFLSRPELI